MEIYLDLYFLVNMSMDFFMLLILKRMMQSPAGWLRLLWGSGAGALASCMAVLWPGIPWLLAFCLEILVPAALMIRIGFHPGSARSFLKYLLVLFLEAFLLGGVMEAMYQKMEKHGTAGTGGLKVLSFLFMAAFGGLVVWILWDWGFSVRRERRMLRTVVLTAGEKRISATGYLDTGNRLRDPKEGRPVHIVSEELWNRLGKEETGREIQIIPFHTIGNALGFMEAVEIDSMEIRGFRESVRILKKPLVAKTPNPLCQDGSYDVLLHEEAEASEDAL